MNYKNFILRVVLIVVVGALIVLIFNKPTPINKTGQDLTQPASQRLSFLSGKVTKAEGSKIYFQVDGEERVAVVSSKTKLIKQVTDKQGPKLMDATLADFRISSLVVVYPDPGADKKEFTPDKIQIIQ